MVLSELLCRDRRFLLNGSYGQFNFYEVVCPRRGFYKAKEYICLNKEINMFRWEVPFTCS